MLVCIHVCLIISGTAGFSSPLDEIEIEPGIRFWGADVGLNYLGVHFLPPLVTRLCLSFGCGYETVGYYRYPDTSIYYPPKSASEVNEAVFKRFESVWSAGIRQGIFLQPGKQDNLFEVHFLYRGKYNAYLEHDSGAEALVFSSGLADAEGILQNSAVIGLYYNDVAVHESHRKRNGIQADLSCEVAPAWFGNDIIGLADFVRGTFDLRGFITVFDLDPADTTTENAFNIYIGGRIVLDCLSGGYIPLNARQSIGGREATTSEGLGGVMRGIDNGRFDGYLKAVNNLDIRMNLPALGGFVPAFICYFDTGVSDNLDYTLRPGHLLFSTGTGCSLYGCGFDVVVYINYFINENRLSPSFDFSLCF